MSVLVLVSVLVSAALQKRSKLAFGTSMLSGETISTMDVLKGGIQAVAVGVSGSKPIPEDLVAPLIKVRHVSDAQVAWYSDSKVFCEGTFVC